MMKVVEKCMLRRMSGHTIRDKIRNGDIIKGLEVVDTETK